MPFSLAIIRHMLPCYYACRCLLVATLLFHASLIQLPPLLRFDAAAAATPRQQQLIAMLTVAPPAGLRLLAAPPVTLRFATLLFIASFVSFSPFSPFQPSPPPFSSAITHCITTFCHYINGAKVAVARRLFVFSDFLHAVIGISPAAAASSGVRLALHVSPGC